MTATTTGQITIAAPAANHLRGVLLMLGAGFAFTLLDGMPPAST